MPPVITSSAPDMRGVLSLSRDAWTTIVAHARRDAPLECCGLLVGAGRDVVRAVAAANLDGSRVRYTIDPHAYLRASREARAEHLDVIGAYHSHPTSPPRPSATDLAEGVDAPFIYVIAGPVAADADPAVRAWEKVDGGFVEVAVRVQRDGSG